MILGGLQKTTLVDYPGKVACTVFTVGCNFRCPFCHNKDIVTRKNFDASSLEQIKPEDFFNFLKKREGLLDGVCITGGEPLIQPDIKEFIEKIKDLGFLVKLDTNGSFPKKLEELLKNNLLDFVAMDIKTTLEEYPKATNVKIPIDKIERSIKLITTSKIKYQFRTTVVPGIHNEKTIKKLKEDFKKLNIKTKNYKLQNFRPENCLDPVYLDKQPFSEQEFKKLQSLL